MEAHEFEQRDAAQVRQRAATGSVTASPEFDGAGGVMVRVTVTEPRGRLATVKVWTRPLYRAEAVRALGAPNAARAEIAPFSEYAPGACFDPKSPPPFYGIATRVFVGLDEVGRSCAVFRVPSGEPLEDLAL